MPGNDLIDTIDNASAVIDPVQNTVPHRPVDEITTYARNFIVNAVDDCLEPG